MDVVYTRITTPTKICFQTDVNRCANMESLEHKSRGRYTKTTLIGCTQNLKLLSTSRQAITSNDLPTPNLTK